MKDRKLLITNIIYFVIVALFVGVRIFSATFDMKTDAMTEDAIYSLIIQVGLMLLIPFFGHKLLNKRTFKQTFNDTNVRIVNVKVIILAILIGVVAFFLNIAVTSFFNGVLHLFGYESIPTSSGTSSGMSVGTFFINLLLIALLPAVCEEFTHRGFLLSGYSSMGIKRAVVFSSLMFGLIHMNIGQVFYATILGFLMAITVVMSKSIIPAIIIHFMNNGINVYIEFAESNGYFGSKMMTFINNYFASAGPILSFIVSFVSLIVIMLVMLFLFILLLKETRIKKLKKLYTEVTNITEDKESKDKPENSGAYVQSLATLNRMLAEYNIERPTDLVFTVEESRFNKPKVLSNIFFYGTMGLGIFITIFTFIWGIL